MQSKGEDFVTAFVGSGWLPLIGAITLAHNPDYHGKIVIYEKRDTLATWATFAANQKHLGLEYPFDEPSMRACGINATIFNVLFPPECFWPDTTSFLVNRETVCNRNFTVEEFMARANRNIFEPYVDAFKDIKTYTGWSWEETKRNLYGPLDSKKFFTKINDRAYLDKFGDMGGGIAGGFTSQQQRFNNTTLSALLETAVRNHPKIEVHCNHAVTSIDPYPGKLNKISFENGDVQFANALVISAGEGVPAFLGDNFPGEITVLGRGMIVEKIPPAYQHESVFIVEGPNGGMWASSTANTAFEYAPTKLDIYKAKLSARQTRLPPLPSEEELLIIKEKAYETSTRRFPDRISKRPRYGMLIRPTVTFDGDDLTKRRMPNIQRIEGLHNTHMAFSPKATHAAGGGINVASQIMCDYNEFLGISPGRRPSKNPLENLFRIPWSQFEELRQTIIDPEILKARKAKALEIYEGMFPEDAATPEDFDWKVGAFQALAKRGSLEILAQEIINARQSNLTLPKPPRKSKKPTSAKRRTEEPPPP
jgi:hypothetical protein